MAAPASPPAPTAPAAEAPSPVVLQPGQVIQDYEIVKPLGKGKFSIVYMAKRQSDNLLCALKKINIFDMMVPKQREKCMKEVRLLQSLDHPHIVKLLESVIDKNDLLIIVEWAEKGDLKRLIRKALANGSSFKEREIWEYSRQLSGALDHMHKKRIMHRDLKPANIFVSLDDSLKLGDLGLGRFFSSQTLEAFSKVGTPLYMSPEVLHGAGYDMRSDVWSLGCVLYELVMLRSPFKSDQQLSLYDLFVRISKGQYPPLPDTTSQEFRDLVSHMLHLDPQQRIESDKVLEICCAQTEALRVAAAAGRNETSSSLEPKQQQATTSGVSSRPSPLLVMDDIVEKLKLLECEELVLKPHGFPLLHRCFFTQRVPLPGQLTQFEVMHTLMTWLLGMLKEREREAAEEAQARAADMSAGPCTAPMGRSSSGGAVRAASRPEAGEVGAGDAAAGCGAPPAPRTKDPSHLVKELRAELATRGMQITEEATIGQLTQGHGEGVCLILNELINQELMGRDFHFEGPAWVDLEGDKACEGDCDEEEVEEDIADASKASGAGGDEDELSTENCIVEARHRGADALLEPIHDAAPVCPEAWKAELARVRPKLRIVLDPMASSEGGEWRGLIAKAKGLCKEIEDQRLLSVIPEGAAACCGVWREELGRIQAHEERLNAAYSERATTMVSVRDDTTAETERLATLHASITDLSQTLATLVQQVDEAKAAASTQAEVLQDPEQLAKVRKALDRLMSEEKQLDVRVRCMQRELLNRSLKSARQ